MGGQPASLLVPLPLGEISLFQFGLIHDIKLIEFFLIEFSHNSKAASVKEEIELFIVFFITGVGKSHFRHIWIWHFRWFLDWWSWNLFLLLKRHHWARSSCRLRCQEFLGFELRFLNFYLIFPYCTFWFWNLIKLLFFFRTMLFLYFSHFGLNWYFLI